MTGLVKSKYNIKKTMNRYDKMQYRRLGASGLFLPKLSLGMWHNFGTADDYARGEEMILHSFDRGITHFDMANNYGPVAGSAERRFGKIFANHLRPHRDELILSSKAGHEMWEGPYGGNSSRKNLVASIDQSLRRTGLEYFDIFYTHRYDGVTPVHETAQALIDIVRQGKALYIGISKYPTAQATEIYALLRAAGVPCVASQYRYSMLVREIEDELLPLARENGSGVVAFSSLAQGLLAGRYLSGIPASSRMGREAASLPKSTLRDEIVVAISRLSDLANERGESLAQLSLAWALRDKAVTSLIIGASSVAQIDENLRVLDSEPFTAEQLQLIDEITLQNQL